MTGIYFRANSQNTIQKSPVFGQVSCRKIYALVFLFVALFFMSPLFSQQDFSQKPLVVIVPSYNNIEWCESNLDSIFMQKYSNYRVIYINDCSSDGTESVVENYIRSHGIDYCVVNFEDNYRKDKEKSKETFFNSVNKERHKFTLVNNVHRYGAMANFYRSIHSCDDNEIVVTVDGDDWLFHDEVFAELNEVYSNGEVWLTHGNLIEYPSGNSSWCEPVSEKVISTNTFRRHKCPSHLRTFYVWLFKRIHLHDLIYKRDFFPMTCDMATMFPMIEMAGERHAFISNVNYVYNTSNPINDNKVNAKLQRDLDRYIRKMKPYQRLEARPL